MLSAQNRNKLAIMRTACVMIYLPASFKPCRAISFITHALLQELLARRHGHETPYMFTTCHNNCTSAHTGLLHFHMSHFLRTSAHAALLHTSILVNTSCIKLTRALPEKDADVCRFFFCIAWELAVRSSVQGTRRIGERKKHVVIQVCGVWNVKYMGLYRGSHACANRNLRGWASVF